MHETEKEIDTKTLFDFMEVDSKSYDRVRENLKYLRDKSWWFANPDGSESTIRFFRRLLIAHISFSFFENL